MSDFLRLLRKELRELFRPRYLLPLLMAPLIFVLLAQGIGGVEEQLADEPVIGVVDADGGELGAVVNASLQRNAEVVYNASGNVDLGAAVETVRERGGEAVVVIPDGFTERIRGGQQATVRSRAIVDEVSFFGIQSKVPSLVGRASQEVTLRVTGASPQQLAPVGLQEDTVVKGEQVDASPGALASAFATGGILFIPIVISVVVLFAGQMVMNSMGVEKENKTLETLLTMPIPRRTIVLAKLVGSASIGLVGAGLYTASLYYYQSSFGGGGGTAAVSLSLLDYALIGASLSLALVGALALALCLGLFADDRQGAQSLLLPLGAVSFVPVGVTLFTEVSALSVPLQVVLYLIPFTHPVIAPKLLLFGDPTLVYLGIAYEALFAVGTIALAVRIFDSDRIVTGSTGRLGRYLRFMQR